MRCAWLFLYCLSLAFACAAAALTPLLAADLGPPRQSSADEDALIAKEVVEFCHGQRLICRRICDLRSRFEDRFDGCPHSCDSREVRCSRTGCYRWMDPEYVLAQKFGAHKCAL